jgi:hypothetical protein
MFHADVNLLTEHKNTIEITQKLLNTNKEVDLELNVECMFMSCNQNEGQNHYIKIAINLLKMWQSSNIDI